MYPPQFMSTAVVGAVGGGGAVLMGEAHHMAKFGHWFLSGVLWVAIAFGIGLLGLWVVSLGGIWSRFGQVVVLAGFSFAGLAVLLSPSSSPARELVAGIDAHVHLSPLYLALKRLLMLIGALSDLFKWLTFLMSLGIVLRLLMLIPHSWSWAYAPWPWVFAACGSCLVLWPVCTRLMAGLAHCVMEFLPFSKLAEELRAARRLADEKIGPRVLDTGDRDIGPVALDGAGRVAQDVPCRTCGYNLRGLSPDGQCPECGAAVGRSIHGDLLRYSDPVWVRHLAAGPLWMIISVLSGIGIAVFNWTITGSIFQDRAELPLALIGVSVSAVGLVGYWMLTMRDPRRDEKRPIWNIRQMTRLLAAAGFLAYVVALTTRIPGLAGALPTALAWTVALLAGLFVLAGLIGALLLFIHMRRLALRIPKDNLARQTRIVMWGIIIFFATMMVGWLVTALIFFPPGTPSSELRFRMVIPAIWFDRAQLFGRLLFGIWWTVLLCRYRNEFRQAARSATETSPPAAPPKAR